MSGRTVTALQLDQASGCDHLTGLPGARLARIHLDELLQASAASGALVGIVELARLGSMDSNLGDGSSDAAMFVLADRLNAALPEGALLSRIDNKQLLLAISDVSGPESHRWGTWLSAVVETPAFVSDLDMVLDISVGLIHVPAGYLSTNDVIAQAGVALARARQSPSRAVLAPASDGNLPARFRLLESFARDLRQRRGIELHHQPQFKLDDMELVGTESLIRWTNRDGIRVPPSDFIPAIEQTPLIGPMTRWVLTQAATDIANNPVELPRVAVNISARSLGEPDFVEQVTASFPGGSDHMDLSKLELEITETALMNAPDRARRHLSTLRGLGATVSLDDFGTGFSSLGALRDLPVDSIKIDRSFVIGLGHDIAARRLIRGIVDLAHALELKVVAEGIEDEAALDRVREAGCDIGQGYYLGRPCLPPVEVPGCNTRRASAAEPWQYEALLRCHVHSGPSELID